MANAAGPDGRESGTGQDTPTVCVHVPPRFSLRRAGHGGTLSRPVRMSRIGYPTWPALGAPRFAGAGRSGRAQEAA
jgi:hypothetical protein